MKITLKQLRAFETVARMGSVSKAADALALSQSATSMSLADLESHLGQPLFHRQGKRLALNDYGRYLQPKAHALLMQAQFIEESALRSELHGHLRVGASSTIGNYLLPGIVARFVAEHPGVHIDLVVGNTEQIEDDMLRLNIDLGLIEGLCHSTGLSAEKLCGDRLAVFCRPGHELLDISPLSSEHLREQHWILREPGSGTREIFTIAAQKNLPNLLVDLELSSSEAIKQAVKACSALGCLSELAIAAELESGELCELHVADLDLYRELYVLQRLHSEPSYLASIFLKRVNEDVNKLV